MWVAHLEEQDFHHLVFHHHQVHSHHGNTHQAFVDVPAPSPDSNNASARAQHPQLELSGWILESSKSNLIVRFRVCGDGVGCLRIEHLMSERRWTHSMKCKEAI